MSEYTRSLSSSSGGQDSQFFGLRNQGATCYLNSVLQVLFMTRDFRQAVKRRKHDPNHIDLQLASLFEDLRRNTAETAAVTDKLGIDEVNQQRDAAEYLERILNLCSEEASRIFHGELEDRIVCDCGGETVDRNRFWNLPLPLVKSSSKSYSVVDGVEEFFKESLFTEDNQLYCDHCCSKSDSSSKCVMTRHPEVLMLLLKRFEFNYQHMSFVKNDHVVDVPYMLNIPENQLYEMYAFVEHFGSLRGGHYTATIKCRDGEGGRWFNFNDSSVTPLENQPFLKCDSQKSRSAYLLFYRKKKMNNIDNRERRHPEGPPKSTNETSDQSQNTHKRQSDEKEVKKSEESDRNSVTRPKRVKSDLDNEAAKAQNEEFESRDDKRGSRNSCGHGEGQVYPQTKDKEEFSQAGGKLPNETSKSKRRKVETTIDEYVNSEHAKESCHKPDYDTSAGSDRQIQKTGSLKRDGDKMDTLAKRSVPNSLKKNVSNKGRKHDDRHDKVRERSHCERGNKDPAERVVSPKNRDVMDVQSENIEQEQRNAARRDAGVQTSAQSRKTNRGHAESETVMEHPGRAELDTKTDRIQRCGSARGKKQAADQTKGNKKNTRFSCFRIRKKSKGRSSCKIGDHAQDASEAEPKSRSGVEIKTKMRNVQSDLTEAEALLESKKEKEDRKKSTGCFSWRSMRITRKS